MATKHYINDTELYYEIVLSQGKGQLTNKACILLMKIADNFIYSFHIKDEDDRNDAKSNGLELMMRGYKNFNRKKYNKALPYFSEVFKRAVTQMYKSLIVRRNRHMNIDDFVRF